MKLYQASCEQEYQQRARDFKTQMDAESAKETEKLRVTIRTIDLDNVALRTSVQEMRDEKEKFRDAYNMTVQELSRLKRELDIQAERKISSAPILAPSEQQRAQEDSRWGAKLVRKHHIVASTS